jgi:hypothetical protein
MPIWDKRLETDGSNLVLSARDNAFAWQLGIRVAFNSEKLWVKGETKLLAVMVQVQYPNLVGALN